MAEHLTQAELNHFITKMLPPRQLLWASRHLATCPECARRVPTSGRLPEIDLEDNDGHLTYEQIEACVDGTVAPAVRRDVDRHLPACKSCADDVTELQRFALGMAVQRAPAGASARSLRAGIAAWFGTRPFPLGITGAALVVVAAAITLMVRQGGTTSTTGPTVARLSDNGRVFAVTASGAIGPDSGYSEADRQSIAAAIRDQTSSVSIELSHSGRTRSGDDETDQIRQKRPEAHLLLGALYQARGRWVDAQREYGLLLEANPSSRIAQQLAARARAEAQRGR